MDASLALLSEICVVALSSSLTLLSRRCTTVYAQMLPYCCVNLWEIQTSFTLFQRLCGKSQRWEGGGW